MVKTMAKKARRAKKQIEEVVQFALGHRTRVHILILLNEDIYTAAELAKMIDQPLNNVHGHLSKMLEDGSIEIAREERKGNMLQYWYRAVEVQYYSPKDFERLPYTHRQNITGAILQSGTAEVMAGFFDGKLATPEACCYWDWYNLDTKGREDAQALYLRFLDDMREIEVESTNRVIETEEETTSMLLDLMYFERPRKGLRRELREARSANTEWKPIRD